jgi:hypothetical protein
MSPASPGDRSYTIPDFAADDEVLSRYQSVSREVITETVNRELAAARAEYQTLGLRLLLRAQEAEATQKAAAAADHRARAKYAAVVPAQRTASGVVRPPTLFFDIIRTMGAADKLYDDVIAAMKAKRDADIAVRVAFDRKKVFESKSDAAIVIRELEIRRRFKTESGKQQLDADPRVHDLAQRCAEIEAERKAFRARQHAGQVSDEELRDREMARVGSRFLDGEVLGLHALREREVRFGNLRYFTFADENGRLWLLDYRDDLSLLLYVMFDLVYDNDRYFVTRTLMGKKRDAVFGQTRLPGPDPRANLGVDPRVVFAVEEFAARERPAI